MEQITLDSERQHKAKNYARISRRLMIVDLLIGGMYFLVWLLFGWSISLRNILMSTIGSNEWLLVAVFALVFGGIYFFVNLPLSFYEGFLLPHRFDMSNQTVKGWLMDQIKGLAVGVLLGGLLLEIIYAVLRAAPDTWWLWAAGIMLLFNVILANLAPVIFFPIFYKFTPLGDDYQELSNRLINLAGRANTRVQGVYRFDMSRRTKAANAALTGLGNTRRIILGDTLLCEFGTDEIETILAHELGHHVHKDIQITILLDSVITLVGFFLASLAMKWGVGLSGLNSAADVAAMPLFGLVMGVYGLLTMPLTNGFSRWREKRADDYALRITGKGQAFASALARLANQNLADAEPEAWVEFFLHSHPAIGKRIQRARAYLAAG